MFGDDSGVVCVGCVELVCISQVLFQLILKEFVGQCVYVGCLFVVCVGIMVIFEVFVELYVWQIYCLYFCGYFVCLYGVDVVVVGGGVEQYWWVVVVFVYVLVW